VKSCKCLGAIENGDNYTGKEIKELPWEMKLIV